MQPKKNKRWVWALTILILLAGGGWWWGQRSINGNGATSFRAVPLERGDIRQTVTANGALEAVQTVLVGSEVSGKIVALYADYNTPVTNGQVLAQLDASTYERQVEQATAELESAKAALKLATANFTRAQELRALELVSQADYDQAEATCAQARASLQVREASLSKAQVDLEKTTIFSPMNGVVISREVDVGQTVAASLNAPTLFTLAQDLREMRIEAQISEADVGGVAEGQAVSFTVDAFPTRTFTGQVSQVRYAPVTNQGVVNYMAIVDVDNHDLKLRPGMTANAEVVTAQRTNIVRLPNAALRFRPPEGVVSASLPEAQAGAADSPTVPPSGSRQEAGRGAQRESRGPGGGRRGVQAADTETPIQTVYGLDAAGGLRVIQVKVGISDGTWTEIIGERPAEGERIVTGIQVVSEKGPARGNSTAPFMGRPPRMR